MLCRRMSPAAWHRGRSYCKIHTFLPISWCPREVTLYKCDILAKSGQLSGLPRFLRGGWTPEGWLVSHRDLEFRVTLGEAQGGFVPSGAVLTQPNTQIFLQMRCWVKCLCLAALPSSSLRFQTSFRTFP